MTNSIKTETTGINRRNTTITETINWNNSNFIMVKNSHLDLFHQDTQLGAYSLFALCYLKSNYGMYQRCTFTINTLLSFAGISSSKHPKSKKHIKMIEALHWLAENEIITHPEKPFSDYALHEPITVEYLDMFTIGDTTADGTYILEEPFTKLLRCEYDAIVKSPTAVNDLYVFLSIKRHIFQRREDLTIEQHPESYPLSYDDIRTKCNISKNTAITIVNRLKESGLIASQKPCNIERFAPYGKAYIATGTYSNLKTVYVLRKPGWEEELKEGVKKYISETTKRFKYKGGTE